MKIQRLGSSYSKGPAVMIASAGPKGHNGYMKRFRIDRDYIIFLLLILPLPLIGLLDISTTTRFLLLLPVIVLQVLFVMHGIRRGGPRR